MSAQKEPLAVIITPDGMTLSVSRGPRGSYVLRANGGGKGNVDRIPDRASLAGALLGWIDPDGDY